MFVILLPQYCFVSFCSYVIHLFVCLFFFCLLNMAKLNNYKKYEEKEKSLNRICACYG